MRFGVVRFPGSNCDTDCVHVIDKVVGETAVLLWHGETSIQGVDVIILPGGFAHGDYLRTGAMAKFSPIMTAVKEFALSGGLVIGICNGFQVLTEVGLLPGALLRNIRQQFICDWVHLQVENNGTPFTKLYNKNQVVKMPIAHGEGRYYIDEKGLRQLEMNQQIVMRYVSSEGKLTMGSNVNGSVGAIAGVCNAKRNVFGLMPHPERCCEAVLGEKDGLPLFESMQSSVSSVVSDYS